MPIPVRSAVQADTIPAIVERIADHGYAVTPGFLDVHLIGALVPARGRSSAMDCSRAPAWAAGRIDRYEPTFAVTRIGWLDEATADPAYESVQRALEGLRIAVNRELALGLFEFEGHYALYPAGARYARHKDRFRDDDARVLSIILYLNDVWRAADGGALRLFVSERETIDIVPAGGTLVTFLADRFDHEVLPANRPRVSLTGWFRRRA